MRIEVTCNCGAKFVVDGGSITPLRVVAEQVREFNAEHTICRIAAANQKPPADTTEAG